ncbi:MAG: 2-C-methyl-D-erythritol 2,4-cyclodiphosphate synthase [Planctomycetaceae bacterium]|nr:2-C-methyl-D-erythritol 2,4-cyclodiphosphate synthase [Planctomycetaceae bacterium]
MEKPALPPFRIGFGTDIHRLVPGDGFRLGGIDIACSLACDAVSDGDVLLHAVVDAMLGSLALGDIGDYYNAANVAPGEDSARFVRETLALLGTRGGRIVNLDAVVDLEAVRFSPYRLAVRERLAALLHLPVDAVSVKAKTAEGFGPVGAGEAVRVQAVVLVALGPPSADPVPPPPPEKARP